MLGRCDLIPSFEDLTQSSYESLESQALSFGLTLPPFEEVTECVYSFIVDSFLSPHNVAATKLSKEATALLVKNVNFCLNMAKQFCDALDSHVSMLDVDSVSIDTQLKADPHIKRKLFKHSNDDYGSLVGVPYETTAISMISALDEIFCRTKPKKLWDKKVSLKKTIGENKVAWTTPSKERQCRVALVGSTQCGKTGVFTGLYFLYPVILYVLSDGSQKALPFINMPSEHTLRRDTSKAASAFRNLMEDVVFTNSRTGFSCSIADYWHMLETDGLEDDPEAYRNTIFIRSSKAVSEGRDILINAYQKGYAPVAFIDEPHHGSNKDGNQDQLHQEFRIDNQLIYVNQITVGATCDEQTAYNADDWVFIPMVLGPGYVGPAKYNGQVLPYLDGYIPKEPHVFEIRDYLSKHYLYNDNVTENALELFGTVRQGSPLQTPSEKRTQVHAIMSVVFDFFQRNPYGKAACLRVCSKNEVYAEWVEQAITLFPNLTEKFVFKQFYGDHSDGVSTAKKLCKEAEDEGKIAIILVTARARLGTAFPGSTLLYLDLTKGRSTKISTVIQGLYGRATGYKDVPGTVILREIPHRVVEALRETDFSFIDTWLLTGKKPGWRTKPKYDKANVHRKLLSHSKSYNLRIWQEDLPHHIISSIQQAWHYCGKPVRSNIRKATKGDIWKEVIAPWNPGKEGVEDRRYVHLEFNRYIMRALNNDVLRELFGDNVILWNEEVPKAVHNQELAFCIPIHEIDLQVSDYYGGIRYRWYDSLEDAKKTDGGRQARNAQNRYPAPQFGCAFADKICPQCGSNTKNVLQSIRRGLPRYTVQTGNWIKSLLEKLKDVKGSVCCFNNAEIEVLFIDLYLKKPMTYRAQQILCGKHVKNPAIIQAVKSRFEKAYL